MICTLAYQVAVVGAFDFAHAVDANGQIIPVSADDYIRKLGILRLCRTV